VASARVFEFELATQKKQVSYYLICRDIRKQLFKVQEEAFTMAPDKQVVLTVDVVNGKVTDVTGVGNISRVEPCDLNLEDLRAAGNFKHVGTLYHRHNNPYCFYFEYLGSIWEICFPD
jgi:hypothetical protein